MPRRVWVVVVGTTLLTGVLPGCTRGHLAHAVKEPRFDQQGGPDNVVSWDPQTVRVAAEERRQADSIPIRPSTFDLDIPPFGGHAGTENQTGLPSLIPTGAQEPFIVPKLEGPIHGLMPRYPSDTGVTPVSVQKPFKKEPLLEALHCVLENRHDEALLYLQNYDHDTQELFIRLLPPMAMLTQKTLGQLSSAEVAAMYE